MCRYLLASLLALGCATPAPPKVPASEAFGHLPQRVADATPLDDAADAFMLELMAQRELSRRGAVMPVGAMTAWARMLERLNTALEERRLSPLQATRLRLKLEEALQADGAAYGDIDVVLAERAQTTLRRLGTVVPQRARKTHVVLDWPVYPVQVTSPFGTRLHPILADWRLHQGIDLLAKTRQPVATAGPGVVIFAGQDSTHGNFVEVRHDEHVTTSYSHLDRALVSTGDAVIAGQLVGLAGETGRATGVHLHFEVRLDGLAIDPTHFLPLVGEGFASLETGATR